ncbi:hypothetical protein LSH36_441g02037 [Paralvinella palmiformis]|uniref:Kinesin motor domain-containing protein n=1 Tax=Paralvinella palmiformis TaxID=53620 RepID=A0AAD9MXQ8_9ANNE|nr:hypothetical protein LSH36_441g02037 [Paralvinella palmiformis]
MLQEVYIIMFLDTVFRTLHSKYPGGDSKTLMIVQVAPVEKNVAETVASLVFAQRVRAIELGQATRRVDSVDNSPSEVCNKRYVIEVIP